MKQVKVYMKGIEAGVLIESDNRDRYIFEYLYNYSGEPVSLRMPVDGKKYSFSSFPPLILMVYFLKVFNWKVYLKNVKLIDLII